MGGCGRRTAIRQGQRRNGQLALAESVFRPPADAARAKFGRRSAAATIHDVMLARALWERGEEAVERRFGRDLLLQFFRREATAEAA